MKIISTLIVILLMTNPVLAKGGGKTGCPCIDNMGKTLDTHYRTWLRSIGNASLNKSCTTAGDPPISIVARATSETDGTDYFFSEVNNKDKVCNFTFSVDGAADNSIVVYNLSQEVLDKCFAAQASFSQSTLGQTCPTL